jgi:hypothetical protein
VGELHGASVDAAEQATRQPPLHLLRPPAWRPLAPAPPPPHMEPWRWHGRSVAGHLHLRFRRRAPLLRRVSPLSETTSSVAWRVVTSFISSGSCDLLFLPSGTGGLLFLPPPPVVVLWAGTTQMTCCASGRHITKKLPSCSCCAASSVHSAGTARARRPWCCVVLCWAGQMAMYSHVWVKVTYREGMVLRSAGVQNSWRASCWVL